jgi:hypothetical protein
MEYTKEQIEIINCKEPVIIAEAYAGCAKSTTAIGFSEARPDKKILYLVYNSSMGKEAKKDFKHIKNVTVKTTHGLAYSKFGYKYSNAGKLINSGSYRAIDVNHDLKLNDYEFANSILDVWNKYLLSNHFTIDDFCKDYFSVKSKFTKKIQKSLEKLWELKTDLKNDIKVEHNLYLKEFFISGFAEVNKYDILIIDEMQDSSKLVQYIFEHAECEQKLALGDSLQSIYGFNGAINVLDNLKGYKLPLTASFRINQTTANICNLLFSKFGNKKIDMKGVNEKQVTFNNNINPKQLKKAVIICRTNAMVFGNALELSQNSYLYFEGGISGYRLDFYNDLWWFSCGKPVKNPFLNKFESYRQLCTYAEDTQDVELLSSINIIKLYNKQIPEGIKRIKESSLNNKQKADYILTTAHKSKGNTYKIPVVIENDFSSLFEFEKIKMQLEKYPEMDKKTRFVLEEQIKEPLNLIYVAITRAFDELYLNEDILNWLKKERVVVRE